MRRKFSPAGFAIPNLTLAMVILTAAINGIDLLRGGPPAFSLPMIVQPGWWNAFLFPFRVAGNPLNLLMMLYLFWMFGSQLENELGDVRYNLYLLAGFASTLLGTYFYPLTASHVYLSVFLAVAHLAPDAEILLFFFIPVRLRWLAIGAVAFVLWPSIQAAFILGSLLPMLGPIIGLGNYALFFLIPVIVRGGRPRPASVRRIQRTLAGKPAIHRCSVCGITEKDDPTMDFRFCVDCDDQEYCSVHLGQHSHVKVKS